MPAYRIYPDIGVYFVTFTVTDWLPIFRYEKFTQIVIESVNYCIQNKNLRVNAYVVMPDHMHAVVFDANFDQTNLHQTLTAFRKFSGRQLADALDADVKLSEFSLHLKSKNRTDRKREFWKPGWHTQGVFSQEMWAQKVEYIHHNPVRKGLVKAQVDWPYSSAGYWLNSVEGKIPISDIIWQES